MHLCKSQIPQTIIKTKIIKCYDPASHGLVIRNDGSKSKEYVAKQRCVGWKTNWSGRSACSDCKFLYKRYGLCGGNLQERQKLI